MIPYQSYPFCCPPLSNLPLPHSFIDKKMLRPHGETLLRSRNICSTQRCWIYTTETKVCSSISLILSLCVHRRISLVPRQWTHCSGPWVTVVCRLTSTALVPSFPPNNCGPNSDPIGSSHSACCGCPFEWWTIGGSFSGSNFFLFLAHSLSYR